MSEAGAGTGAAGWEGGGAMGPEVDAGEAGPPPEPAEAQLRQRKMREAPPAIDTSMESGPPQQSQKNLREGTAGISSSREGLGAANNGSFLSESAFQGDDIPLWRLWLRHKVSHRYFTSFIYLCIAWNTVTIAMNDIEVDRNPQSTLAVVSDVSDWVILVIFTIEMILKMMAFGHGLRKREVKGGGAGAGVNPNDAWELHDDDDDAGYFQSNWNCLDGSIVIVSWLLIIILYSGPDIAPEVGRLVRILRIARPLRALRTFDGTQDVLKTFPHAFPAMRDVLGLLVFIFIVYSILGVNLFGVDGNFHGRCVVDSAEGIAQGTQGFLQLGNLDGSEPLCGDGYDCSKGFRCSCKLKTFDNGTVERNSPPFSFEDDPGCFHSPARLTGNQDPNNYPICPNNGMTCWSNFAEALFTCFTAITLDSWTVSMWWAEDSMNPVAGWAYFISLIVIVSFNIVNLYVAVISAAYRSVCERRARINRLKHSTKMVKDMALKVERAEMQGGLGLEGDVSWKKLHSQLEDQNKPSKLQVMMAWAKARMEETRGRKVLLNRVARTARRITMMPMTVDECGKVVPPEVLSKASEKNLRVEFGPAIDQWSLYAEHGPATLLSTVDVVSKQRTSVLLEGLAGCTDSFQSSGGTLQNLRGGGEQGGCGQDGKQAREGPEGATGAAEGGETRLGIDPRAKYAATKQDDSGVTQEGELAMRGDGGIKGLKRAIDKFEKNELALAGHGPVDDAADGMSVPYFDIFILFCIILNTASMMSEHHVGRPVLNTMFPPEYNCCNADCTVRDGDRCPRGLLLVEPEWTYVLFLIEACFNFIFSAELAIKLVAFWSLSSWATDNFPGNLIDAAIIIVSDITFILSLFASSTFNVNIFRLVRIMRAFRLVSRFRRLRLLFNKAFSSFKAILNVLFVLVFWHVLGSLLGMQIFRCDARLESICQPTADGSCPEGCSVSMGSPPQCVFSNDELWEHCVWDEYHSFNSFYESLVLLLFVTTGENWVGQMQTAMLHGSTIFPGLIFFLIFYIISFYMLFNLFIGVILQEFELTDEQKMGMQLGYFRVKVLKELRRRRLRKRVTLPGLDGLGQQAASGVGPSSFSRLPSTASSRLMGIGGGNNCTFDAQNGDVETDTYLKGEVHDELMGETNHSVIFGCLPEPTPNARFPDAPKNLRAHIRDTVQNPWFDRSILVVILISTAFLATDTPVKTLEIISPTVMLQADYTFFGCFLVEFIMKILDHGIYWESKRAYFKSGWNVLDSLILLFQLIDFSGAEGLKFFRIMRVLRPLRLLNKIKSLQLLIVAVQACAVDMFNVLLLWIFAFIVFGIVGVDLFAGTLYSCSDAAFVGPPESGGINPGTPPGSLIGWRENCVGTYYSTTNSNGESYVSDSLETAILLPRRWANPTDSASDVGYSFDNFGVACQTLFEVSTFEQWSDYVFATTSITQVGQQPISKNADSNVFYLHAWVILSCFFVLQLVIGVLVDAINQKSGKALYTALQRNWVQMEMKLINLKPLKPVIVLKGRIRNRVWAFVNNSHFQNTITVVIILNILFMTTESYGQSEEYVAASVIVNWTFIAIYCFEILLKLVAYLYHFFTDPWNLFDFAVVISSVLELTLSGANSGLQALRVLRMLKVFRTIRLVRRARRLRLIVGALIRSVPHIASSIILLALFVFLFAVLGMQLFAGVRQGYGLQRRNNFENALNGCLTLLRVLTGENWETVMRDCSIQPPFCTPTEGPYGSQAEMERRGWDRGEFIGDCGNPTLAILFFDVFYLIGNNVLLNLFIAVLLDNFFTLQSNFVLSEQHLESYQKVWRDIDPLSKGVISIWRFRELVERLHADNNPLGSCVLSNEIKFRTVRIELMQDRPEGRELDFLETVGTLALHVVGAHGLPYAEMVKRQEKMAYYTQLAAVSRVTSMYRSRREARKIQRQEREGGARMLMGDGDEEEDEEARAESDITRICMDLIDEYANRETVSLQQHPRAAASVAEISLSAIGRRDLERAIKDVEAMLGAVKDSDRFLSGAYAALTQLVAERQKRPGVWPQENPKRR